MTKEEAWKLHFGAIKADGGILYYKGVLEGTFHSGWEMGAAHQANKQNDYDQEIAELTRLCRHNLETRRSLVGLLGIIKTEVIEEELSLEAKLKIDTARELLRKLIEEDRQKTETTTEDDAEL